MKDSESRQFSKLLNEVMSYYRQEVTPFIFDVWWNACKGFDYEQISRAVQKHATDPERGQFPPKVADMVRILQGTTTDRAAIAWGKTHEAMSSVGSYSDVVFDDPAIHATVDDLGGWPKVCRTDLKELSHLQHRFMQTYRAYVERGEFDYPKRLGGARGPDSEYLKIGMPLPKPAIVGDLALARQVYKGGGNGKVAINFASIQSLVANQSAQPRLSHHKEDEPE